MGENLPRGPRFVNQKPVYHKEFQEVRCFPGPPCTPPPAQDAPALGRPHVDNSEVPASAIAESTPVHVVRWAGRCHPMIWSGGF